MYQAVRHTVHAVYRRPDRPLLDLALIATIGLAIALADRIVEVVDGLATVLLAAVR